MGFKFGDYHSFKNFGLITKIRNRPIMSQPKTHYENNDCMDGEYDFSEANPQQRLMYESKNIEVDCALKQSDSYDLIVKSRDVAGWLAYGEKRLIFDDEKDVYYLARVNNKLDYSSQFNRIGKFTAQFKCQPYRYFIVSTGEDVILDSDVLMGTDLLLGGPPMYTKDLLADDTFLVDNFGKVAIDSGVPYAKFDIILTGSFTNLSITLNGRTFNYNAVLSSATATIDCVNQTVYQGTTNKASGCSGDFLQLLPGNNVFSFTGTNLNLSALIDFRPMWF